ncbi:hypothetical protein ACFOZ7_17010 [Natribaculum luteum]|uniref:Uncharacterized protein n=1 Tax=Natribaculum luteum TaxID=1586232 RepID=A0ABD5P319_9EURY|nr:hypothetical protein [Natribaculum luteum]
MEDDRLGGLFDETHLNAAFGWVVAFVLCTLAAAHVLGGSYRWFVFTGLAVAIVLAPAVALRDPLVMPSWELLVLVSIPIVDATAFDQSFLTTIAVYVAVAAVALVVAVEIHHFTRVRMSHSFAISLVVITTLAVAAVWNVAQWVSDVAFGTAYILDGRSQDAANRAMMIDFVYATIAGFFAGVVFDRYFRARSTGVTEQTSVPIEPSPDDEADPAPTLIRDRLDVSDRTVTRLTRAMQLALGVLLCYGLVVRDLTTIVNASIALAITFFPAFLERDYRLPLEPGLVFWLTAAAFLHTLGSAGLYDFVGVWDNVTHALSASIVAAGGYAVVRAIDLHTDDVYLPPKMLFAFILLFVLAFGVVWELLEFAIDGGARRLGLEAVLAQHGVDDTISDLVFDLAGAAVAASLGSFYLTDVAHRLADRFDG